MYLLLGLICCVAYYPAMMLTSRGFEWIALAPFVAANCFSAWVGLRGGKAYPGVLIAVCVDLTLGMVGLVAVALPAVSQVGLAAFVPFLVTAIGIVLAPMVERSAGVSSSALPVRGEWGRRFLAGCVVMMLQPASPGVLYPATVLLTNANMVAWPWIGLWLVSALFYLAPIYRRIVSGVPAHVDLSRSQARATTLGEFLAADAATNPNVSRSFARFVIRCESEIYRRLRETGLEPDDAGRRCRGLLRDLWHDPNRTSYESLSVEDLQAEIDNRTGPWAPVGCERLLLELALEHSAPNVRELTSEWIDTREELHSLKTAGRIPRELVSRRVHTGIEEALSRIALALPVKSSQGNRTTSPND